MDPTATVLSRDQLQAADLQRLLRHEITALHVREFYPRQAARQWGRELDEEAVEEAEREKKVREGQNLDEEDQEGLTGATQQGIGGFR